MKHLPLCLALSAAAIPAHGAEPAVKPNILIILSDDYGWGSSTPYGAKGVKTPNMDRLAREGRRFTQAYAPGSVCSPSRYGLVTGRYYWRTSVKDGKVLTSNAPLLIEKDRPTIATICKGQGYRTVLFGKWHLGMTAGGVTDWTKSLAPGPMQVGFDHYFGLAGNVNNPPRSFIDDEETTGTPPWQPDQVMENLTARATDWLAANRDQPFFMYFAPNAVHEPVEPNPRFTGSRYGKYGDFIEELDSCLGRLLATLDRLQLTENTLVIFTSDNGGVTAASNVNSTTAVKAGLAINGPLRGGKESEWEGGFREPFIVRWPGKVPAGTVSDQVVCLTDLMATCAGVLHAPLPKGSAEDSFDLSRAFTESAPGAPVRDHVILQAANATYDIRMGDWKLVERANPPVFDTTRTMRTVAAEEKRKADGPRKDELFNLKDDPFETKDVAAANPALVSMMKQRLVESRDHGYTRPGAGPKAANLATP